MIWHLLFITELCFHRCDGPFPTALVNFTKLSMIVRLTHKLARPSTIRIRIGSLRFNFQGDECFGKVGRDRARVHFVQV